MKKFKHINLYTKLCFQGYSCYLKGRQLALKHTSVFFFVFGTFLLYVGIGQYTIAQDAYSDDMVSISGPEMLANGDGFGLQGGKPTINPKYQRGESLDINSLPSFNPLARADDSGTSGVAYDGRLNADAAGTGGGSGFNTGVIKWALNELVKLMRGPLGGLLTAVAGAGAVVAGAFGAYRAGFSLLVVAIGSFCIDTMVKIYFGDVFSDATNNGTPPPAYE